MLPIVLYAVIAILIVTNLITWELYKFEQDKNDPHNALSRMFAGRNPVLTLEEIRQAEDRSKEIIQSINKAEACLTGKLESRGEEPNKPEVKIPRGWKKHDGKGCPLNVGTMCKRMRRFGGIQSSASPIEIVEYVAPSTWTHGSLKWSDSFDIIAYKVIKPKTIKRKKK